MKANWIWINEEINPDEYVRFKTDFCVNDLDNVKLGLSCDSIYNVWINGKLLGYGMMHDFEFFKMKDEYELKDFCTCGKNVMEVLVYYHGEDANSYRANEPGLWFEISENGKNVCVSDENVFAKFEEGYVRGYKKFITVQVGFTYKYDFNFQNENEYKKSVITQKKVAFASCNAKNLVLAPFAPAEKAKECENSVVYDLGKEHWGYLSFKIDSEKADNYVKIVFGEHIRNGHLVERFNDKWNINYHVEVVLKKGENDFTNLIRALGLRYFEVFGEGITVKKLGVYPLRYPFTVVPKKLKDPVEQKIYDTSLYTIVCCAYKHFVDCPWREQGSYILDSYNQMLCAYKGFDNPELIRYNVIFFSKGLNVTGLLCSCQPNHGTGGIPFFSLVYFLMVDAYLKNTGDYSISDEILPALDSIISVFYAYYKESFREGAEGLVKRFKNPFWNFYEWTENNDHWLEYCAPDVYDVILNCAFLMAVEVYQKILAYKGKTFNFDLDFYRKRIHDVFFDEKVGLVKDDTAGETYSRMGNAIAVLAGVLSKEEQNAVAEKITNSDYIVKDGGVITEEQKAELNKQRGTGVHIVDISLANTVFYYDALLKADKKYAKVVREDIFVKYKSMLDRGATTFWETIDGADGFGGSGSMCHGWSAIPVYYYNILPDME